MKQDPELEVLHVSKAVSSTFEYFDFVVNSLQRPGANWVVIVVEDAFKMVFDHIGHVSCPTLFPH